MSLLSCKITRCLVLLVGLVALTAHAVPANSTLVNINPDKNGQPWLVGGLPPFTPEVEARWAQLPKMFGIRVLNQLPSLKVAVDNSKLGFFPPVISQTGGSCAQASGIGYIFTYELAAARSADASLNFHRYPEHFTWNFLNRGAASGSWQNDGWDIAQQNGIPSVETYGGMASPSPYTQWMSGYDKYYQAMGNRAENTRRLSHFSSSDMESIKAWLDHRGVGASTGGVAGFSVYFSDAVIRNLPNGQPIITRFGADGGHSMTIVGYDDTIKIDINNDGRITTDIDTTGDGIVDIRDSEVGAFRIANTWGEGWGDKGFAWVPYSTFALPNGQGGIYANSVQVIDVVPAYTPEYALKVTLIHPKRGDIKITAGVASTTSATVPEQQKVFTAFDFKGGDHPVRGDSTEAIELGLDITDLMANFGSDRVAKVFLVIQDRSNLTKSTARIQSVSLMDYSGASPIEVRGDFNVAINHGSVGNMANTYAAVNLQFACDQFKATLSQHETAGRAYSKSATSWWTTTKTWYAVGSNESLGTSATLSVILHQPTPGVFRTGSCPVVDTTPPVLTLVGKAALEISQGSTFVDPGVTAMDDRDGDITDKVTITGMVKAQIVGTYILTYNVSDYAGNAAKSVTRTVRVVAAASCQDYISTVTQHETAGRAYSKSATSWWTTTKTWYAKGSNESLGTSGTVTKTLREKPVGSGVFEQGTCPAEPLPPQPPVITSANASVAGSTVTISGSATDPNNDLHAIVLYFSGGGLECNIESPIGKMGDISYNCADMSKWSFVIAAAQDGLYDCQGNNACVAVGATDTLAQGSELKYLSFRVGESNPVPPIIASVKASVSGSAVTITGSATDANNDLEAIVLYYSGGGFECNTASPVGTIGDLSYNCSDMSSWSFVIRNLPVGTYDCQGSNACIAVKAVDSKMQDSGLTRLFFKVSEQVVNSCFTALNTDHAQAQRAELKYNVLYYTVGGGDYLGLGTVSTSLSRNAAGAWKKVNSCAQ